MAVKIKDQEACIACASCVNECPQGVLEVENTVKIANVHDCISCGLCVEACPVDVLALE